MSLKISTSQIGRLSVGMRTLAHELGHEWVDPCRPGLVDLAKTRRSSPEYCCFPFRLALADIVSALERGADTIVFFGGKGICRLAMYQAVQQEILRREGREFRAHVVSNDIRSSLYGLLRDHSPYGRSLDYHRRTFAGFWKMMAKLKVIERWRRALFAVRPYARRPGEATDAFETLAAKLAEYDDSIGIARLYRRGLEQLREIPLDTSKKDLPRIGIIGESYACIDEGTNRNIARRLAVMGLEVVSPLSEFKFMSVVTRLYYKTEAPRLRRARRFFKAPGGGDSLLSAAYAQELSESCDGILHLYPFTCLPETSVRQLVEPYLRAKEVPYLHFNLDEQTGHEGFATRLETFADVVRMRRRRDAKAVGGASGVARTTARL